MAKPLKPLAYCVGLKVNLRRDFFGRKALNQKRHNLDILCAPDLNSGIVHLRSPTGGERSPSSEGFSCFGLRVAASYRQSGKMSTVIDACSVIGPYKMIDVTNPKTTIEHIIRQLGLTSQRELAERFEMSLHDVENAAKGNSQKKLEAIYAKARVELGMPANWPDKGLVMIERVKALSSIKIVGSAMAGEGAEFEAEEMDYEVPAHLVTGVEFGYIVQGTSLMPRLQPMDLLIARPMREPAYNRIMIVRRPDATVSAKIVLWRDNQTVLASTDGRPDEPANVEFMGLVTGWIRPSNQASLPKATGMRYDDLPIFPLSLD